MDEFGDGSFVNLDDISDTVHDYGEDFDVNDKEGQNDLGGPSVGAGLGETDHRDKRIEDMTGDDIRCMEFTSEEDGRLFYQSYAKRHGFVVRKDEVYRDFKGNVIMRQFV
ncbi:protein FAR1-RELATED SEQUENCE 5-like [Sesbania bispinosa]|nr:protein FAR1-RELATED SEQUENCE 5-like [Sesbania bispinosa]